MANPKGNPQTLKPFKPKGEKALYGQVNIRVDFNKKRALKSIPNWTDKLRDAIDRLIEEEGAGPVDRSGLLMSRYNWRSLNRAAAMRHFVKRLIIWEHSPEYEASY